MANTIFGVLGIPDADYAYVRTVGQEAVYDATKQILGDHNADMLLAEKFLVESATTDHKTRYYLADGGRLERAPRQARVGTVKAQGSYDVAYPLEEFGARIDIDRISMAYMSLQQYDRHVQAIMRSDRNTVRHSMLAALFNNGNRTFNDEVWGSLTVVPLANGDSVVYPPVVGSEDQATAQNYLASGYVASSISDVNNPIPTIVNTLEQHFGTPTGGSEIAVFFNNAQTTQLQGLTGFDPIEFRFQTFGANVSHINDRFRAFNLPGRVIGEMSSAILVEWRWIPANYLLAVHLGAPPPLKRRQDPPDTGLPEGLQLIAEEIRQPFKDSTWSHRYGFGVGNRLNGVIMQLTAGSYAVPSGYSTY